MVIVLAFFLPRLKIKAHQKLNLKVDLKKLIKNNNFFIVSFAIALAMAGVSIVSMYNSTIIYELGGKVESIGLATIMQMGSEVIFAWFAFKLAKKHGHLKLIFISMIVLLIRWLVTGIFFVYEVYYFSIWIEGFTTIFILILGMDYIKNIVVPQLISTSITIYTSITLLIYAILVNVAGYLRDTYSTSIMFYFLAVVTLLAIIVLFVKRRSLSQN